MAYPSPAQSELIYSTLPLWIVLIPLAGSFFVFRAGLNNARRRDYGALLVSGLTLSAAAALFISCSGGAIVELRLRAGFFEPLLYFRVDLLGALFTLLAALIWFLATLFSLTYMRHEGEQDRFYLFYLLSLGSCLGIFLAGDLLSLFLFFEIMTFTSYVLVVHTRTAEADEAGRNYLFLGVIGGLLRLTAILLLYFHNGGNLALTAQLENLDRLGGLRYLLAFCLMAGFGVKAGAVPLHIWLPKAHPVAPSPASALLSGIMIKTGAYGIIRVLNLLFTPRQPEAWSWQTAEQLGLVMIWVGVATMFSAACSALFQNNAKRILAYSSISQMGYILMGLGTAAYLGHSGATGLAGSAYHVVNHAFFKAALFMLVGAVYVRTHRLDLRRLGGLWRSFPVTTLVFLIAAAGITGLPGANGYTSKTLLHHAILEAVAHGHNPSLIWAERIFTVTSVLTVCYMTKLCCGIFFGRRPEGLEKLEGETVGERVTFGLLGAGILLLGLYPGAIMNKIIIPAASVFTLDHHALFHLGKLHFFDPHNLEAIAAVLGPGLALGLLMFVFFGRPLYRIELPAWLGVEQLVYRPLVRTAALLYTGVSRGVETAADSSYIYSPYLLRLFTIAGSLTDYAAEKILVGSVEPLRRGCLTLSRFDREGLTWLGEGIRQTAVWTRDLVYNVWFNILRRLMSNGWQFLRRLFFMLVRIDYNPEGNRLYQAVNISNLDFNLYLVIFFLLALLSLFFLLS